jgi:hypothetical protein
MGKRMKQHLSQHTNEKSEETYKDVSSMIRRGLKKLVTTLSYKITYAAHTSQSKIYRDLSQMITNAGGGQDSIKPDAVRMEFQAAVLAELKRLQDEWAQELKNPSVQLRAVNPLARFGRDSESSDKEDEDDESGSDGKGDESGTEASDNDSGSEDGEDDNDDV